MLGEAEAPKSSTKEGLYVPTSFLQFKVGDATDALMRSIKFFFLLYFRACLTGLQFLLKGNRLRHVLWSNLSGGAKVILENVWKQRL